MTNLTKRDWFAGMAMQAMMRDEYKATSLSEAIHFVASTAYDVADAMLFYSDEQGENLGDDLGEFDWSQAKPGMAFRHYQDKICWYIGPSISNEDFVVVSDKRSISSMLCLILHQKSELTRAPEHDVEAVE